MSFLEDLSRILVQQYNVLPCRVQHFDRNTVDIDVQRWPLRHEITPLYVVACPVGQLVQVTRFVDDQLQVVMQRFKDIRLLVGVLRRLYLFQGLVEPR